MRDEAMNGLVRGRKPKAGAVAKDSQRAPDLLNRDFTAARPNAVWVTDFTYVRTWAGFAYVAFAIDVFSRAIVGWHGSTIKDADMALTTLKMSLWRRDQAGTPVPAGMVHHSDAGSQYTSIRFGEALLLEGLAASVGSVGDAYDIPGPNRKFYTSQRPCDVQHCTDRGPALRDHRLRRPLSG